MLTPDRAARCSSDQVRSARSDRVLRAQAELDNYRKRARRELDDERRYACLPVLRNLLPVVDNFERAMAAAEQSQNFEALIGGVKGTLKQLQTALQKGGSSASALGQMLLDIEALRKKIADSQTASHAAALLVLNH